MSNPISRDFIQGVNPVGSTTKGARDFQQSSARDRNIFLPAVTGNNWIFTAGWGLPVDALTQDGTLFTDAYQYVVDTIGSKADDGVGFLQDPLTIVTGIPWNPRIQDPGQGNAIYGAFGFNPSGNFTYRRAIFIRPGKYALSSSGIGFTQTYASPNATGTIQVYATPALSTTGILIGTFPAGGQQSLMPTFDSRAMLGNAVYWTLYFVISGAGPSYPTERNSRGEVVIIRDDQGNSPAGVINVNINGTRIA